MKKKEINQGTSFDEYDMQLVIKLHDNILHILNNNVLSVSSLYYAIGTKQLFIWYSTTKVLVRVEISVTMTKCPTLRHTSIFMI